MPFNSARALLYFLGLFLSVMVALNHMFETGLDTSAYTVFVRGSIYGLVLMGVHYFVTRK